MKDYSDLLLKLKYRGSDYSVTQEAIQAITQLQEELRARLSAESTESAETQRFRNSRFE